MRRLGFHGWRAALWLALVFFGLGAHGDDRVFFRENFDTLDAWEPLYFPGITRHSVYKIEVQGQSSVLKATSDDAASALVHRQAFDAAAYPILRWRWKVTTVYADGDYRRKSGDDYPMRVYVLFAYDPDRASIGMRLRYGLARAIYGRYPPYASLNYIWANRADETEKIFSPYTDRSLMIPLEHGPQKVGQWIEERVDLLEDYRAAFGRDPPPKAALAVMIDSDNTGGEATAYLDFIEVGK
jgi:hypothetical protein